MIQPFLLDQSTMETLINVRRDIHRHPELSHQETRTKNVVLCALEKAGITDVIPVGEHGLTVDITGTAKGLSRKVGIRGDMDALPIQERTQLPFASQTAGVMHACGHDAHTAMALATGIYLHERRSDFSGTVRLLFQHSEETLPSGAREFVDEGRIDDLDGVIGIHVDPMIDTGRVAARPDTYACSSDHFDIYVSGKSSHGGKPHEGVDAISIAAGLVQEITKIRAQNVDPIVPLTVTVGIIAGGSAHNIISETASLHGTIRSAGEEARALAKRRLEEIACRYSQAHGGTARTSFEEDAPVLVNDKAMVRLVRRATVEVAGDQVFIDAPMWTASDDFAYFSARRPGVYFRLGVRSEEKGHVHALHHPEFSIDEDALPLGVSVLAQSALSFLGGKD